MKLDNAKIVLFDIENTANKGFYWGKKWETDIIETTEHTQILSYSAKIIGGKFITRGWLDYPGYKKGVINDEKITKDLWKLFNENDILIAHNGRSHDIPICNTRFLYYKLTPPEPSKFIDTKIEAKKYLSLPSYSLDDICNYFGIGHKLPHQGWALWKACVAGDPKAWRAMKRYNCLTPDHKVLNTNLNWIEIGKLNIGDTILGFDEDLENSNGNGRRLRKATVLNNRKVIDDVYEVILSNGDKIKCTKEHKWLCSSFTSSSLTSDSHGDHGGLKWRTTEELIINGKYLNGKKSPGIGRASSTIIYKYFNIINELPEKDAGWVAGMFDGEGSLSNRKKDKNFEVGGFSVSMSQRVGQELDKVRDILIKYNIQHSINIHPRNYHAEKSNGIIKSTKEIGYLSISGGFGGAIEFLQKFRPERLIHNINWLNLPRMECRNDKTFIKDIKYIGKQEVFILETDTKTYFADGYAMHNCHDVELLHEVYLLLRPWIMNHPNLNLYQNTSYNCRNCGGNHVTRQGFNRTKVGIYQQLQCQDCGAWIRGDKVKIEKVLR